MNKEIKYKCNICPEDDPYTSKSRKGVKIHIGNTEDKRHKDRSGSEPGVVEEVGEEELMELNQREEHNGEERVEITKGRSSYSGSPTGLDATMQNIGERPVKGSPKQEEEDETIHLPMAITFDELVEILNSQDVSEETRKRMLKCALGGPQI